MPTIQSSGSPGKLPDGIVAAVLACAIAGMVGQGLRSYVQHLANHNVSLVTTVALPFKYQTLTFQRAALGSGHVLPIYGSSELFCCGEPFRPTEVFASRPTGFDVLALGHAGSSDLVFAQTFAALGHDLRRKRVVVSDSPSWFSARQGLTPARYASSFSPEAAYAFVFEAPVPPSLREIGARRMLAYPETLRDDPLLRRAVEDLAHPTRINLAGYAALAPLGHLATWALEVRDAVQAGAFLWKESWRRRDTPAAVPWLDWVDMAARATRVARAASTTNPFGFTDATYRELGRRPKFRDALALYDSGHTNRDGAFLPASPAWGRTVSRSAEWADLRLALRVLHAVGARPLVWTLPLPGAFYDYTAVSAPVRRTYYERFARTGESARVPWLDFRAHDEDRFFVTDPGSHLSARGWVFADRALDVFWHAGSLDDIRTALATLDRGVPVPELPPALADAGDGEPVGASD